jgi:DNA repair exonuclease SbcCD ATPase subunit
VLEEMVAAARRDLKECETQLTQAQQQQGLLEQRIRDRQTVTDDLTTAEGVQAEAELLARLLGRDRLQLHLVRQAERRVVEYANVVLDRLSGGQLYLQLQGDLSDGAATRALNLVCINRQTDERPINVAFLSGSQRFRVAVSLALGIGQYASRQHRPLECVIIDEGFGCLDRQGRQVMIQELQNLRNCLRSILLVSHQEEFADAFPNGYHFALVDGTTEVTRVQR